MTIVGAGTTTITASQSGNANYLPAASVPQTLTVAKASQTISNFPSLPTVNSGASAFTLNATASSGLSVGYGSSNTNVVSITGNTVTIVGAGPTVITASQPGNANYNAAPSLTQTQQVTGQTFQSITFNSLPGHTYGDGSLRSMPPPVPV